MSNEGLKRKKILIVEDNPDMRQLESDILTEAGYDILEAERANTGIELALKEKPDLIIMDIRLPSKKRGIGAAKILRNDPRTCDIPIIFVTAYLLGEDSNEVKNISNCGYVTKPFKIDSLVEEVKRFIDK